MMLDLNGGVYPVSHAAGVIPARLLVVDADLKDRVSVAQALSQAGCIVEEASSADKALELLQEVNYDLLLLNPHLPDIDGTLVLHQARQLQPDTVIIVLTGCPTLDSAVAAVKAEAVDYLLKPIQVTYVTGVILRALLKRADQLQRRRLVQAIGEALHSLRPEPSTPTAMLSIVAPSHFLQVDPLLLDRQRRLLLIRAEKETQMRLTESETVILACLMARPEQVLTCRELVRAAWGLDLPEDQAQSMVRPHIFRLRQKLEGVLKTRRLIHTLRRRGYFFSGGGM